MRCFIKNFFEYDVFSHSAQCAFYFMLSLFPFLFLTTHFAVLFSISNDSILNAIRYAFPKTIYNLIVYNFHTLQLENNKLTFYLYIILALWSSSLFINSLKNSINFSTHIKSKKNFIYNRFLSVIFTLISAVIISGTLFITLAASILLRYLSTYLKLDGLGFFITKSVSFFTVIIDLILLYMFLPINRIKFKTAIPGALFSAIGIIAASNIYSFYINNIANPSKLYGALGSIIMLMIWLYIISFILITGGIINNFLSKEKLQK